MNQLLACVIIGLIIMGPAMGAPLCGTVIQELSPCLSYLMRSVASPSHNCCNGVKAIAKFSRRKKDRSDICRCIKPVASSFPSMDTSLIPPLPGKCGLRIRLPSTARDTDCSKV
ncbi:non-specific lipid-transfer protein A-like [Actinidia eriantha]|uniref:non-specific lipid-transfer protein A-like n=1 Tax=Actinidia eriantha TaxID=165200 RepID=UPI002584C614|nr:non-specific lipid-transfer protein A-like [Actinidia eriantha]